MSDSSLPNPLLNLHERQEAELQPYAQTQIVSTFGRPELEYSFLHKKAGLMDLPQRGIIEISGDDRLPFLNNLLTNQVYDKESKRPIAEGSGVYSFLLNRQGRVLVDLNVLERPGRTLLEMDGRFVADIAKELDKYLFREKVKIASLVGKVHELALLGPGAKTLLEELTGQKVELERLGSINARLFGVEAEIWRDDPTGTIGFMMILPADGVEKVWTGLIEQFGPGLAKQASGEGGADASALARQRLVPVGWAAFNSARIEAGTPIFGIDFDSSILPAETGLMDRAVNLGKGCYVGQEVVARMHARGQLAKKIVGIRMNGDALPMAGSAIYDAEHNQVGGITSSTLSPIMSNSAVALGLLKKGFFEPGTEVRIPAEGDMRIGRVVELPFVR